ncbi:hypothetical protein IT413_03900 [Candidatus Peregrinibacteria bacterium]|nr:hypothetical protein [Candidatus Peregrinibacteria bacterium]
MLQHQLEAGDEALSYEVFDELEVENAKAESNEDTRPLRERLLQRQYIEEIGVGPYRSTKLKRTVPTFVGKLVNMVKRNRRAFAAIGMVASVSLAAKQGNELLKVIDLQSSSNVTKPTSNPADQVLVPYAVIGGVNMEVSPANCFGPLASDCQINLGSGPKKLTQITPTSIPLPTNNMGGPNNQTSKFK